MSDTAEKPKSKRQLRDEVIAALDEAHSTTYYQKCPYTCSVVNAVYHKRQYIGIGFSKVSWPDPFIAKSGHILAKTRAIKDIANQILKEQKGA